MVNDPIVMQVVAKQIGRSAIGQQKYGTTLLEHPAETSKWLEHLQEELMDAVNYIERLQVDLKTIQRKHEELKRMTNRISNLEDTLYKYQREYKQL